MNHTSLTNTMADRDFEQVVVCRDPATGLESVIAVHDTTLGPALGGIRMRAYRDLDAAVADALDLAEAMTYKAALAGLDLGGGKSVINADPRRVDRERLIEAHARYIGTLGGRYIPAVDMGTTVHDLDIVGRHVTPVSGRRRDPSVFTAQGVVAAIRAAVTLRDGSTLSGVRVAVQGVGHVGRQVVALLAQEGVEPYAADVDPARLDEVCREFGATPVDVEDILAADVDVIAPCAAGGVLDERALDRLKARYVVGAANNLLAHDAMPTRLTERGIVHVPDFVANAGGLIACEAEVRGDDSSLSADVEAIGHTTRAVLDRALQTGADTVTVAIDLARSRIDARRGARPFFRDRRRGSAMPIVTTPPTREPLLPRTPQAAGGPQ
ncbi:Glu/Leu/Phe/Val dehydrogenase dimerization domain-containing protein [Pseudonocardia sp.]|uniref:Glu/Leu/Phe/Val dehydrogenase family protein n=1 Tax=Pseudonocardia sp. TaxID=60912 RepID=UPI003D0B982F